MSVKAKMERVFEKARPHKYIKRLGAKGKYQYFYPFVKEESGEYDPKADSEFAVYQQALLAKEKKDGTTAKDKAGNIIPDKIPLMDPLPPNKWFHPSGKDKPDFKTSKAEKLKREEILHNIGADKLSRTSGVYTAKWGYFYTHGATPEKYANKIKAVYPNAEIVDQGDHWHAMGWTGGAQDSYMWVKFKIPAAKKADILPALSPLAYKEGEAISEKLGLTTVVKNWSGYEITHQKSGLDPKEDIFTVWPSEGNAVGSYKSLDEAKKMADEFRSKFDKDPAYWQSRLNQDGGANFKPEPKVLKLDEPFKEAKKPLHEPTEDKYYKEWAHEKMRITNASWDENRLRRRLNAVTQPQKLYNFARALDDENLHDLAGEAYDKLKAMGYTSGGEPFYGQESMKKLKDKFQYVIDPKKPLTPEDKANLKGVPLLTPKEKAYVKEKTKKNTGLTKVQRVVDALNDIDGTPIYTVYRGYSGRGMYGEKCLGIVGPDIESIMIEASKRGLKRKDARTDNMGLDYIVYWPDLKEQPEVHSGRDVYAPPVEPGRRIDIGHEEYEKSFRLEEPFLKSRTIGAKDAKKRKHRLIGQVAYHSGLGKTGRVTKVHEGLYASSIPHVTVTFDNGVQKKFSVNDLEIRKLQKSLPLEEPFEKGRGPDKKKRKRRSKGNIEGKLPIHEWKRKRISPKIAHESLYGKDKDPGTFAGRMKNLGVHPKFIIGTKEHKAEKEKRQYGTHIPKQGG